MGQGEAMDSSQIPSFSVSEDTHLHVCCLSVHQLSKTFGNPVVIRTLTPLSNRVELKKKSTAVPCMYSRHIGISQYVSFYSWAVATEEFFSSLDTNRNNDTNIQVF